MTTQAIVCGTEARVIAVFDADDNFYTGNSRRQWLRVRSGCGLIEVMLEASVVISGISRLPCVYIK